MKLAYFSPMPPAKTGIATYSRHLVAAMRKRCQVTVFTATPDAAPLENVPIVHFGSDPHALKRLAEYDRILYHVGNNPGYHLEIWRALTLFPGAVCLHDVVIYYLVAGLGKGALLKELMLEDPSSAFAALARIEREAIGGELLRFQTPSRHPCVRGLLESTDHVLVHNRASALALAELGFSGRIDVLPLLHYPVDEAPHMRERSASLRAELGYSPSEFVLGAFGFIGPTKRLDAVLQALAQLSRGDSSTRARLLIVGEGDRLEDRIRELGVESLVKTLGFVPEERFAACLCATDAVVNLRYPSHGESSATLIQAMALGKPCVVTDHASFSELPDETVLKVSFDDEEVPDIARCIEALLSDRALAARVGEAGRAHVSKYHAADMVASRFVEALRSPASKRVDLSTAPPASGAQEKFSAGDYLVSRARELVP